MRAKATSLDGDGVGEFGDKFRKAREKKGFSFDDVSHVTKIGVRMLQAIEEEHFDRLPGGVFNKGFIRTYAKHLGMNDDEAIASYLACVRQTQLAADGIAEPPPIDQPRAESSRGGASAKSRKGSSSSKSSSKPPASAEAPSRAYPTQAYPTQVEELPDLQLPRAEHVRPPRKKYLDDRETGIPWRIVAVAGLVIVFALIVWTRHSRHVHAQAAASAVKSAVSPSTPAPNSASSPNSASYQTASARSDSAMQSSASQSATTRSPTAKPVAGTSENAVEDDAGATGPAPIASSPEKAPAPLTLIIRATETSWISVRADGQEVTAETLIAPAHTSVRAAREIVVKTGNAAGINFLLNGKEVSAQGTEAEVRTFIFDAAGLRTAVPPQNQ